MHRHERDEKSAPNQSHEQRPADLDASLAIGVPGAQPPLE
jgi:hypothetical protein